MLGRHLPADGNVRNLRTLVLWVANARGNLPRAKRVKERMDCQAELRRTLILGNSGSGKSWLSVQLGEALGTEVLDLDHIHWESGSYNTPRDEQISIEMTRQAASRPAWVIEGVYGWLAREVAPHATALIWLDTPVDECVANLRQRGLRRTGDAASFDELRAWAADYPRRQTSSSRAGHERIFLAFPRRKFRLASREDVDRLLAEFADSKSASSEEKRLLCHGKPVG